MAYPRVNLDLCIGCGVCVELCPDVFEMNGDLAEVRMGYTGSNQECCQEAVDACPVDAITLESM